MNPFYIIGGLAFVLSLVVRGWLKRTYRTCGAVPNGRGLTGAQVARRILDENGLQDVRIEAVKGNLTDHYDPRSRTVRLSEGNFAASSVAALAVSAHEVGHALQHAKSYVPLRVRSALVPLASLGTRFGPLAAIFGAGAGRAGLLHLGIGLFGGAVLFQLVTLPVEFDASRRALKQIETLGIAGESEMEGARRTLTAAAMTYVAAAATAIGYFLYVLAFSRRGR